MTTNEQLELGFNGTPTPSFGCRRETRTTRAQWWFARMREAVANAIDWDTRNEARPEQMWIPGANRSLKV